MDVECKNNMFIIIYIAFKSNCELSYWICLCLSWRCSGIHLDLQIFLLCIWRTSDGIVCLFPEMEKWSSRVFPHFAPAVSWCHLLRDWGLSSHFCVRRLHTGHDTTVHTQTRANAANEVGAPCTQLLKCDWPELRRAARVDETLGFQDRAWRRKRKRYTNVLILITVKMDMSLTIKLSLTCFSWMCGLHLLKSFKRHTWHILHGH